MAAQFLETPRKVLGIGFLILLAVLFVSWRQKGGLPGPDAIQPVVLNEPVQLDTEREPFDFEYKNQRFLVEPVAEYELWGLVVSHNNIMAVSDLVHDASSIDTKDLCVVWGQNITEGDYQKAEYRSGQFVCYVRWRHGEKFFGDALSNNHLIMDNQALRDVLAQVRVGDQIHLKGMLANYRRDDTKYWRRSSTTRTDTGDGACETIFYEDIEILQRGGVLWYTLYSLSRWGLGLIVLLFFGSVVLEARARGDAAEQGGVAAQNLGPDGELPEVWGG